jgi:hypothetical protein
MNKDDAMQALNDWTVKIRFFNGRLLDLLDGGVCAMRALNETPTRTVLFANYLNFMPSTSENFAHDIHAAFFVALWTAQSSSAEFRFRRKGDP